MAPLLSNFISANRLPRVNVAQTAIGALMMVGGAASLIGTGKTEKIPDKSLALKKAEIETDAFREAVRQDKITKDRWLEIFSELDQLMHDIDRQIMWSWAYLVCAKATGLVKDCAKQREWFEKTMTDLPLTWQNKEVLGPSIKCGDSDVRLNLAWSRMSYYYDLFREGRNHFATKLPGFIDVFSKAGEDYQKFLSYYQIVKHCRATLMNPKSKVVDGYKLVIANYREGLDIYEIDLGSMVSEGGPISRGYTGRARAEFKRDGWFLAQEPIECIEYHHLADSDILRETKKVKGGFSEAATLANGVLTHFASGLKESTWAAFWESVEETILGYARQFAEFIVTVALEALGMDMKDLPNPDAIKAKGTGRKIVGAGLIVGGGVVMIGGLRP